MSMTLRPIGFVRSPVGERKSMPPLGVPATVEVLPEFGDGLLHVLKHTHLWVLVWLDRAERDVLQVTPRGVTGAGPGSLHGVFAVRSPVRPNPIGLTAARVVAVRGTSIDLDALDFLDGTPVIDLKPYFVSKDLIFSANNAPIGRPASLEALRASLLKQAVQFHGEWCAEASLAVRVVEHFRASVLEMTEPEQWRITVPLGRPCLIDAVMGMTRATPGRGSLEFHNFDALRFLQGERAYLYRLPPAGGGEPAATLAADERLLFDFQTLHS